MANSAFVLELLDEIKPQGRCDDCLSEELDIRPRQTINQMCRALFAERRIKRVRGECGRCGKVKAANFRDESLAASPPKSRTTSPKAVEAQSLDIEKVRTEMVRLCRELWRQTESAPASVLGARR
jgi:hypothetical protein